MKGCLRAALRAVFGFAEAGSLRLVLPLSSTTACGMVEAENSPDSGATGGQTGDRAGSSLADAGNSSGVDSGGAPADTTDSGDVSTRAPDANAGGTSTQPLDAGNAYSPDAGNGSPPGGDAAAPTAAAIVLFGGADGAPGIEDDTWEWNGATWTNLSGGYGPSARTGAAMASIGDKVVLFGGFNGVAPMGDTWEWDGAVWTQLDISGPAPRSGELMAAFDGNVILFGGTTTGSTWDLSDTWSFDGNSWTMLNTSSAAPSGGWGMASPSADEPLVLFGAGPTENQTWAWDAAQWAQIDVAAGNSNAYPLPGQGVLADLGDSILLLDTSALDSANPGITTTWQWIAGGWTNETQVASLSVGPGTTMASFGDSAVLFSGFQDETWIWSAGQWSQASPATSPSSRQGQAMATRFAP